ncbi:MAG TPA: P1 family peptidase [Vicinamibacteria bacterium]|nr:P1 family peptidase [Vicinamibacteria bacterium]
MSRTRTIVTRPGCGRRRAWASLAAVRRLLLAVSLTLLPGLARAGSKGLTEVPGVKVGHFTLSEKPTGCTAVLTEYGATAGVDVRGGAPGTRETDLLEPRNSVSVVHAIVLSGGSAFGLEAATGVVRWLEERGHGYDVGVARVPIVPAAILFDLPLAGKPSVRPGADCGYRAAAAASDGPVAEGNVGAGAGATVGKLLGPGRAMKAGIGSVAIAMPDGLVVGALVAVNAVGDVIDPASGKVVAGVRTEDGKGLADARVLLRSGSTAARRPGAGITNTTLGVVATNVALTKAQAQKVAQMAHDGLARALSPVHTPRDGDTVFALATARLDVATDDARLTLIGALAAEAIADAIVRAALQSSGLPELGLPAARDLAPNGSR